MIFERGRGQGNPYMVHWADGSSACAPSSCSSWFGHPVFSLHRWWKVRVALLHGLQFRLRQDDGEATVRLPGSRMGQKIPWMDHTAVLMPSGKLDTW